MMKCKGKHCSICMYGELCETIDGEIYYVCNAPLEFDGGDDY